MSRLVWDVGRADPRGSERLGEREGGVKVELKPMRARAEPFLFDKWRVVLEDMRRANFLGDRRFLDLVGIYVTLVSY